MRVKTELTIPATYRLSFEATPAEGSGEAAPFAAERARAVHWMRLSEVEKATQRLRTDLIQRFATKEVPELRGVLLFVTKAAGSDELQLACWDRKFCQRVAEEKVERSVWQDMLPRVVFVPAEWAQLILQELTLQPPTISTKSAERSA